jgi:hypothetical protein
MVEALTAKAAIRQQTSTLLRGATDSVPTPDGPPVARVNAMTLDRSMANLSPDTKYLPEIQKAVETRQGLLNKGWTSARVDQWPTAWRVPLRKAVASTSSALLRSTSNGCASNAPGELTQAASWTISKGTRGASRHARATTPTTNWALDMDANKTCTVTLSVPEFAQVMPSTAGFPELTVDKIRQAVRFAIQKAGIAEAINSTVAKELA